MLNIDRLKNKIRAAFEAEQNEEKDHNASLDRISLKLATAVVEEIKNAKIEYQAGLVAPNGSVTGTIIHTIS
ncbi:hypothetical protein [Flavobacterium hydatis]|jgi:rubrerythrin|uniref:Uncharacterized protein n=1 Tax=Flavobacterium hydatis TaxID=991 RepID=A0A086A3G9_FLAHY|nr:hypothetical protein [Flavobacterium hydatis]KFF11233.1 hypothetical protein IW20_20090 [Flavobacterium hydatis]OXA97900.1 hypothetical protein B0A62_03315 [Flavobacterium hydatis]